MLFIVSPLTDDHHFHFIPERYSDGSSCHQLHPLVQGNVMVVRQHRQLRIRHCTGGYWISNFTWLCLKKQA